MGLWTNKNDLKIAQEENETERKKCEAEIQKCQAQEKTAKFEHASHMADIEYNREKDEKDRETSLITSSNELEKARIEQETQAQKNKADIEKAYIKKGENIEIAEIKAKNKEEIAQKVSDMFSEYLSYSSTQFKEKINALQYEEEIRKDKYLETLHSTRAEQQYLIDASKDAKGQEKLDYLNKADECEKTIKCLIKEDAEANQLFVNKLAMLDYDQRKEFKGNIENNMRVLGNGDIHLVGTYGENVDEK